MLDVFTNDVGRTILRVQTVRNVYRRLNPEFIEFDLAPDAIEAANMEDLEAEVASYEAMLEQSLRELIGHVARNDDNLISDRIPDC